jgi:hypothetical protein
VEGWIATFKQFENAGILPSRSCLGKVDMGLPAESPASLDNDKKTSVQESTNVTTKCLTLEKSNGFVDYVENVPAVETL